MNDPNSFLWRAFSRNIGLVSLTEQQKLFDSRVAIPGMGGVGGVHLITQARLGIGAFNIADFDTFETENTNRQYGAAVSTYGRSKVDVMAERALDINPHLKINRFPEGLNDRNLNDFLKDVDVVVDGLDAFALDARRLLCNGALERGIPFVTAGPIGFGVSMLVFKPGSLTFDQYFDLRPGMSNEERLAAFLAALTPWSDYIRYIDRRYASLRERRGPSLSVACELCAGFAGTETLKLILKRGKIYPVPHAVRIDSYLASYRRKKLLFLNRGPLQKLKRALILKRLNADDGELRTPSSIPPMESSGPITEEAVKFVVRAGILAISGDNSQHWKFDWDGERLTLSGDASRSEVFYSIRGEPLYLSFGAVLENISIAASALGLHAETQLARELSPLGEIAEVSFSRKREALDPLYPFMYERCCNRANYSRRPIEPDAVSELTAEAERFDGGGVRWFVDGPDRTEFAEILRDSESVIWQNKNYHRDLFTWLRFSRSSSDGLTPQVLGTKPHEKILLPLFKYWPLIKTLNLVGFSRLAVQTPRKWISECGGLCLLYYRGESAADHIAAGRMIERFWIKAQSLGLSLQPMTLAIALYNRWKLTGGADLSPKQRDLAAGVADRIDRLCPQAKDSLKAMIFRMGYAPRPEYVTARRPLEEMLTFSKKKS